MNPNFSVALNEHAIGIIMKEVVRRSIKFVRLKRFLFDTHSKPGYDGVSEDVFTNVDREAQDIYLKTIKECFPGFGIIAEEGETSIECQLSGRNIYFVIDPIDGTKAFIRRQSHAIGTMIALIEENEVISAYVGDIMTQEIFGYRPNSKFVHRISEFDVAETLTINHEIPLKKQYVLLQRNPMSFPQLVKENIISGLFRDIIIDRGSIGISLARLWKGEIGGCVMSTTHITPWDMGPIFGISRKLGFVFIKVQPNNTLQKIESFPLQTTTFQDGEILIVHESRMSEIKHLLFL